MGLVEHIHPYLAEIDYKDPINKILCIGLSIVFLCILYILSAVAFWFLSGTYRCLSPVKKVYWNMFVVRAFFGFHCTVFGAWALFGEHDLREFLAISTNPTSSYAILTGTGFFFFECGSLVVSGMYKNIDVLLNVHHWYALFGFCLIAAYDVIHYVGLLFLLLEMSAPYSGICWILMKAGKGHTLLWKANQYLLVHVYHIRSMINCYICYLVCFRAEQMLSVGSVYTFSVLAVAAILFTFIMTPYWLYKRTQQLTTVADWSFTEVSNNQTEMNGNCKKLS